MNVVLIFCFSSIMIFLILRRDFLEPAFLFSIVWLTISGMQSFFGIYLISLETQLVISACILTFCLPSFLIPSNSFPRVEIIYDPIRGNLLFWLLFFFFPIYIYSLASLVDLSQFSAIALRNAMTESNLNEGVDPIISMGINIPIVLVIYYSAVVDSLKDKWWWRVFFLSLLYVLLSFSKGYLLLLVIPPLVNFYMRGMIKRSSVIKVFLMLLIGVVLLFAIRDFFVDSSVLFQMYLFAPVAALDKIVQGEFSLNTPQYNFIVPIFEALGLWIDRSRDALWVDVGVPTNVFTVFGILINDFGVIGCVATFGLFGVLARAFYIWARISHSIMALSFLGWVCYGVVFSFFSDGLLGMAGTYYKYLIILFVLSCASSPRKRLK